VIVTCRWPLVTSSNHVRLPKKRRISRSSEFRLVRAQGVAFRGKHLILSVLEDDSLPESKVGFITTKRLGNAVVRNRTRRRLRAILVELGDRIVPGRYLVTVARQTAAEASYGALKREWTWLGHRANVFQLEPRTAS
jgi:ribonuclease P protein component